MPISGQRALDHFVVAVRDLAPAGAAWERLGFRVLPKMRHVTAGCANRVVQLNRTYIELLGDIELMLELYRDHYLGRFTHGEGLANICFTSSDLSADRALVEAGGVPCGPITSARRPVVMPDGSSEDTDSDFFYPWRTGHAYMSPFLAVHRRPEIIFVPDYAVHPNTAIDVSGIICQSPAPMEDAAFFALMADAQVERTGYGARVLLASGDSVDIFTPEAAMRRFGEAAPPVAADAPGFGIGLTVTVASLAACRATITAGTVEAEGGLIVPASQASGVFVRFVEA